MLACEEEATPVDPNDPEHPVRRLIDMLTGMHVKRWMVNLVDPLNNTRPGETFAGAAVEALKETGLTAVDVGRLAARLQYTHEGKQPRTC